MHHTIVTSTRKRKAAALGLQLEALFAKVSTVPVADLPALLGAIETLRADLDATRSESDDFSCVGCDAKVEGDDPRAGGIHFSRMARHDGSDRITAHRSAELKLCPDCYTIEHDRLLGMSVERHVAAVASKRAATLDDGSALPDVSK